MPRVRHIDNTEILKSLKINRTVGLEIEGYMKTYPHRVSIRHSQIKHDGSLSNAWWTSHRQSYGCEVVTGKINDLKMLDETFEDMQAANWSNRGTRPGLHIHVDTSDFTMRDRFKAAHFGKSIEDIMFLFVKNYRWGNNYCHKMSNEFLTIFDKLAYDNAEWNRFSRVYSLIDYIRQNTSSHLLLDTGKYNWLNAFSSNYPTIEFRIFHTIKTAEDGKQFAYLAHQFIETVKNSTLEHLQFISNSINEEQSVELKAKKLLIALGVPYNMNILNEHAVRQIECKQQHLSQANISQIAVGV